MVRREGLITVALLEMRDCPAYAPLCADALDPWTEEELAAELEKPSSRCFAARLDGEPAGFACFSLFDQTAELETVAVGTALRGQGIAGALLRTVFAALAEEGATRCLLEVRCSNAPALALYQRLGFVRLARRAGLFDRPREDGFTMELGFAPQRE